LFPVPPWLRVGPQEARGERECVRENCFKAEGWLEHVGGKQEAGWREECVHVWSGWGLPSPPWEGSFQKRMSSRQKGKSVRRRREGLEAGV